MTSDLSFFLSLSLSLSLSFSKGSKARARKTNKSAMMSKKERERLSLRVASRDDKNCAEPKKNTRGLLFFVSLSLKSLLEKKNDLRERAGGGSLFLSRSAFGDDD